MLWNARFAIIVSCGVVGFAETCHADPALSLHLTSADFQSGCSTIEADSLDCSTLDASGDSTMVQFGRKPKVS